MSKPGFIDVYETAYDCFEIGPNLAGLLLSAQIIEQQSFWRRWVLRRFHSEIWAKVIKARACEQELTKASKKAWEAGKCIGFAEWDETGLRIDAHKPNFSDT